MRFFYSPLCCCTCGLASILPNTSTPVAVLRILFTEGSSSINSRFLVSLVWWCLVVFFSQNL